MRFLSLRAIFLLGFVVAMPVLALPPVARRIDELLYGPPPADFGRPPGAAPLSEELLQPQANAAQSSGYGNHAPSGRAAQGPAASPSRFEESSPASMTLAVSNPSAPPAPALSPTPEFGPPSAASVAAQERPIDERTILRLQDIRASLEQLGADYVVVETQDSGRYRFHCRMLVDSNSRFTRPFEASSFDPIAAGEQVLRDVQAWRTAANEPRTAAR